MWAKNEIHIAPVKSEEDDLEMPLRPYEILSYPVDYTLDAVRAWIVAEAKGKK